MGATLRLPNLYILGAGRCGTTFLYQQLARHPDVCMSSTKEPTFFCDFYGMQNPWDYLQQFRHAMDKAIVGECSHAYLTCPKSAPMRLVDRYRPDLELRERLTGLDTSLWRQAPPLRPSPRLPGGTSKPHLQGSGPYRLK